jgi:hypothetical protein
VWRTPGLRFSLAAQCPPVFLVLVTLSPVRPHFAACVPRWPRLGWETNTDYRLQAQHDGSLSDAPQTRNPTEPRKQQFLGGLIPSLCTALGFPFQTSQGRNRATGAPHHSSSSSRSSSSIGSRSQTHKDTNACCIPALSGLLPRPTHSASNPTGDAALTKVWGVGEWHVPECIQNREAKKPKANPNRSRTGLDWTGLD